MTLVFCSWFFIDPHFWKQIFWLLPLTWYLFCLCHHCSSTIKYSSNFRKQSCSCTPKMIDPWSILNDPCLLLFIVDWFASVITDLFLPLTQSLVFWCRHWSSYIKYFSTFRENSLHLHSTIDTLLINLQLSWSYDVDCWLICIAGPRSITPTDPVPGLLLS